jgi:hypothetical protein
MLMAECYFGSTRHRSLELQLRGLGLQAVNGSRRIAYARGTFEPGRNGWNFSSSFASVL